MELEPLNNYVLAKLFKPAERKLDNVIIPDTVRDEMRNIRPAKVVGIGDKCTASVDKGDFIYVRIIDCQQFGLHSIYRGDLVQLPGDRVMGKLKNFDPEKDGYVECEQN